MVGPGGNSAGSYLADPTCPPLLYLSCFEVFQCINCRDSHFQSLKCVFWVVECSARRIIHQFKFLKSICLHVLTELFHKDFPSFIETNRSYHTLIYQEDLVDFAQCLYFVPLVSRKV